MNSTKILLFFCILFTTVGMAASFAHLFELPNKIHLSRADYLTVQQIYHGWALLGIFEAGALLLNFSLTVKVPTYSPIFYLALTAFISIVLSLLVFFLFIDPANQATQNWTTLPENWQHLRRQWEYSHAVGAGLYFAAFCSLTLSALLD